ncbi:MAG: hypothetical protein KTR29_23290 [Rhodothermaceae bacterium]|nr:hypothetical protein [Rhodothermaceae bacterium]
MNRHVEVKYRKFPVAFDQRLADTPAFAQWKQDGWYVTWQYRKVEEGNVYIEALLKRSPHNAVLIES